MPRDKLARFVANIHPRARRMTHDWDHNGKWHKDADRINSSQALCVSVFGSLARSRQRKGIMIEIMQRASLEMTPSGTPRIECEYSDPDLLNEKGGISTPTSIDVLARWSDLILTIESKFTESGFGACSQPKNGACNGSFASGSDLRTRTSAPCRLMVWEGRRTPRLYWDIGATLFRPEIITAPLRPCPFASDHYQLMRNLALACAAAQRSSHVRFAFIVAFVEGAPHARELMTTVNHFRDALRTEIRSVVGMVSYEAIAEILRRWKERKLAEFLNRRLASVHDSEVTLP